MSKQLADLLFPNVTLTPGDIENRYPKRETEGVVTRFAPSPTGFMHIGGLFAALVEGRVAYQSGGVFYLRIEDTDKKREVEGGVSEIINSLNNFGIFFDEGPISDTAETGEYGPYKQSERVELYSVFAKKLVEEGNAYPCFCTEEELSDIRTKQEVIKANPGYYGEWAKHRDMGFVEIERLVKAGMPFVLRFKSPDGTDKKLECKDLIKGKIEMPQNDQDFVLLKSDGVPTYHFAHAVDDHLMGTTHVIRGDEWLSSLPIHLQLFYTLGWKAPKYAHISPVMKLEGTSKRKLSKRKDPEAAVSYYHEMGYPVTAVIEYLLNLANSSFEDWRRANPTLPQLEYKLELSKMSVSGALFDIVKLADVSKDVVSKMNASDVLESAILWADKYDTEFAQLLRRDEVYAKSILSIGRDVPKPRKDIAKWSDLKEYMAYFYDELFISEKADSAIIEKYIGIYSHSDDREKWFEKIKEMCPELGYSPDVKAYKQNPDAFKGHVGDVSTAIRVAITGRTNTPDLFDIMQLLGAKRVMERLGAAL